jgi:hypothetical protein
MVDKITLLGLILIELVNIVNLWIRYKDRGKNGINLCSDTWKLELKCQYFLIRPEKIVESLIKYN